MMSTPARRSLGGRRLTETVQGALADVGLAPVRPAEIIDKIGERHLDEYVTGDVQRAWDDRDDALEIENGIWQPAQQWLTELDRLVAPNQLVSGRIAIIALCLTDQAVAQSAQNTGLLYALASKVQPDVASLLTVLGIGILRKRAPITAFGLGVLEPTVELRFTETSTSPLIALAPQNGEPVNKIGQWAMSLENHVYVGLGRNSKLAEGLLSPLALGWSSLGHLLLLRDNDDGSEFVEAQVINNHIILDGSAESSIIAWPHAASGQVGESGATSVSETGELTWGDRNPVTIGEPGVKYAATCMDRATRRGVRIAALDDSGHLSAHFLDNSREGWVHPRTFKIGSIVAANASHVFVAEQNGPLSAIPWSGGNEKTIDVPRGQQWISISAGHGLVALASHQTIYLASPLTLIAECEFAQQILSTDISPDGSTLAMASADNVVRMWRLDAVDDLRLTAYSNDNVEGPDLLGITSSVDALAALVCARAMQPPLSIGLFGAWGSGKSFFMRKLQARIDEVVEDAKESGRLQRSLWTWRNIRQIRFNAWDYSSGDVWAGLLEKLIQQLAMPSEEKLELPKELDQIRRRRLQRMITTESELKHKRVEREAARKALDDAESAAADAEERLKAHEEEAASAIGAAAARAVSERLTTLTKQALEPLGLGDAASAVDDVRIQLGAARERIQSISGLFRATKVGWLVAFLVVTPLVGIGIELVVKLFAPSMAEITAVIGVITTLLGGAATWIRRGVAWIDAQLKPIQEAEAEAARVHSSLIERVAAADEAKSIAATNLAKAQANVSACQQRLTEAEDEVRESSAGSLLNEYLVGRWSSEDYRSRLGVIGLVRADVETISSAVVAHNNMVLGDDYADFDDVVNRVVLYVDDLDRCRPEAVVKVLEAVHLLLSYPLFVVVVAVDAHWVSQSLESIYPTLLTGGEVTADHYLEKIFQLPVWLDRPEANVARHMLADLVSAPPTGGRSRSAHIVATPSDTRSSDRRTFVESDSNTSPFPENSGESEADLATSIPKALELSEDERNDITALAGLLNRSPRALKRYVNTYRLLKVMESNAAELVRIRILLAIAVGRPVLGERLLAEIMQDISDEPLPELIKNWPTADGDWLNRGLQTRMATWRRLTCQDSARAAAYVHRFVYRTLLPPAVNNSPSVPEPSP